MDRKLEELQSMGILGILREVYNIIFSWKKIFFQITLAFIFPLSFIILAHIDVSNYFFHRLIHVAFGDTWPGGKYDWIINRLLPELTIYFLSKVSYLFFVFVLSIFSTSACMSIIACIYTSEEISFRKVINVVPKIWKRPMVIFLSNFVIMAYFDFFALLVFLLWLKIFKKVNAVSEAYEIQALIKNKELTKGKSWVASVILIIFQIFFVIIQYGFGRLVMHGESLGMVIRVCYGIVCFLLLSKLILVGLVSETIIYFICKSYDHESIDKSWLTDHLEVFLEEQHVPPKSKDVLLAREYFHV